jgi:hypothetical protein
MENGMTETEIERAEELAMKAYLKELKVHYKHVQKFEKLPMDITEAYSELYRICIYTLCVLAGDIYDQLIVVFKNGNNNSIIDPETGTQLHSKAGDIHLGSDTLMTLDQDTHVKNIKNIKDIFNQLSANEPDYSCMHNTAFSPKNAYADLYKLNLIMLRQLMLDIKKNNIRWELYEHGKGVWLIELSKVQAICYAVSSKLNSKVDVPQTYKQQNKIINFFKNIFKDICTAPSQHFCFHIENDKRDHDLGRFIDERNKTV